MATLAFHPLAELFPEMEPEEYSRLVEDIKANGQLEPIWLYEGKILDGRHRYLACQDAKIEPITRVYEGEDPTSFVLSLNLHRRHLNESQRSIIGKKLATLEHGGARSPTQAANLPLEPNATPQITQKQAAELLNVSERSVRDAGVVLESQTPELIRAVEQGDVAVSAAALVARLPEPERRTVAEQGPDAIKQKAKEIRESKKAPAPKPEPPLQPATDNVVSLGSRLNTVPSFEEVEKQVEREEASQHDVEDFDPTNLRDCALAISGALNSFDLAPITGRGFWQVYGRDPGRKSYFAMAKKAHEALTDIINVYQEEYDDELPSKNRRSPR
jgi:ParB-like chromosome segregation protein Spo0J